MSECVFEVFLHFELWDSFTECFGPYDVILCVLYEAQCFLLGYCVEFGGRQVVLICRVSNGLVVGLETKT